MAFDELQFLEWLRERLGSQTALSIGIGDDMALIAAGGGSVLVASDLLLDGVHFDSRRHSWEQIGRKAIARNLSDCAAMAAKPAAVTISVAFPREMEEAAAKQLCCGMMETAAEFEVAIAGGDTAIWGHPLAIDVSILAQPCPGVSPVLRSGARVGDLLYVTGELGGSIRGRHLTFTPRVREAMALGRQFRERLHAMMDISDGLGLDLWRMCQASGTGAQLDETMVLNVAHQDAVRAAEEDGRLLLEHILGDGEDHELLVALDGDARGSAVRLLPIGFMTDSNELLLRTQTGQLTSLQPRGYVHR